METYPKGYGDGYDGVEVPTARSFYTDDALSRKLGELNERIARLERRHIQDDIATAQGKRLLGGLLVLIGRRLRGEDGLSNS